MLGYTAIVDPQAFGWHAEAFVDLYCEGTMPAGRSSEPSSGSPAWSRRTPWPARRARCST